MTLTQFQGLAKRLKRRNANQFTLEARHDLLAFCEHQALPAPETCALMITNPENTLAVREIERKYFVIPTNPLQYEVEGACFTGPQQMKWISDLTKMPDAFVLHIDGKFKLHYGDWVLITIGVHTLRKYGENHIARLTHTFVPLVYQMCKQHESTGDFFLRKCENF